MDIICMKIVLFEKKQTAWLIAERLGVTSSTHSNDVLTPLSLIWQVCLK